MCVCMQFNSGLDSTVAFASCLGCARGFLSSSVLWTVSLGRANINHTGDTMTDPQIPTLLCKAALPALLSALLPLSLAGGIFGQQSLVQFTHRAVGEAAFQRPAPKSRKYLTILTLYSSFLLPRKRKKKKKILTYTTERHTVTKTFLPSLKPTWS